MKKALIPALIVAGAGAAMAATLGLQADLRIGPTSPTIAVVSGATSVSAVPSIAAQTPVLVAPACTALTASAGTTEPAPGATGCGFPSHVTSQDRVWFGTYWQLLQTPIVLGGAYTNARIDRTSDGDFFDGIVDKVDSSRRVTDVILATIQFAGGYIR